MNLKALQKWMKDGFFVFMGGILIGSLKNTGNLRFLYPPLTFKFF
jgi:hypothetical protein